MSEKDDFQSTHEHGTLGLSLRDLVRLVEQPLGSSELATLAPLGAFVSQALWMDWNVLFPL